MVRLVDEDGGQLGIKSRDEALQLAMDAALDLVEVSPNADPPVCKIMDYNKHLYQLNKKQVLAKKKQRRIQVKKLRVRPTIEEGDYQVKLRNLTRFLQEGDKVEISLRFRGREMMHSELGIELLQRIKQDLLEYADVEREPRLEGRQVMMVLAPKKS